MSVAKYTKSLFMPTLYMSPFHTAGSEHLHFNLDFILILTMQMKMSMFSYYFKLKLIPSSCISSNTFECLNPESIRALLHFPK